MAFLLDLCGQHHRIITSISLSALLQTSLLALVSQDQHNYLYGGLERPLTDWPSRSLINGTGYLQDYSVTAEALITAGITPCSSCGKVEQVQCSVLVTKVYLALDGLAICLRQLHSRTKTTGLLYCARQSCPWHSAYQEKVSLVWPHYGIRCKGVLPVQVVKSPGSLLSWLLEKKELCNC